MSLHLLAEQDKLPLHQYIDSETLEWIKRNKPEEFESVDYSTVTDKVNIEEISKLLPVDIWFNSQQTSNTIHGLRHLMRVTIYTYILSTEQSLSNKEKSEVLIAASLHDIRRKDDRGDEGHAKRAAVWFLDNVDIVLIQYKIIKTELDLQVIHNLIKLHEISNKEMTDNKFYQDHKILVDILKTADALDRYIQPKKKWWINDNYLNLVPNSMIKSFAFDLVTRSEKKHLNGSESKISVIEALKEIC